MRLLRAGLIALVAAPFAASAGGHAAPAPRGHCVTAPPRSSAPLPAALTITTNCGAFEVDRDGSVRHLTKPRSPVAPEAHSFWPSGIWTGSSNGHLLVGWGDRIAWRSHNRFPREYEVDVLALGRHALAFSYGWRKPRLFVASLSGREHLVARDEYPLGWTRGGFYTHPGHGGTILLRAADGTLRSTIGKRVLRSAYDQATRRVWFVARGELYRAYGDHVRPVAKLALLGLAAGRSLDLMSLGKLLVLEEKYHLVVLRSSGSVFASTLLPRQPGGQPWLTGEPTAAPGGAGVAFAAMRSKRPNSNHVMQHGVETVYLLRPGARAAVPVHRERLRFNVCGHGAQLSWQGRWLLYSTGEGNTALIDSVSGRSIELTSLVRHLPGFSGDDSGGLRVAWSEIRLSRIG